MKITIDTQAKAAYLKIKDGTPVLTKEILPEVFVDFDSKKNILGIELISPCTLTLRKVAQKLHLPILNKYKKPLQEICS